MGQKVAVGQVVAAHGVRGEVRVYPLTDFPERFRALSAVWLGLPPDRRFEVEWAKPYGKVWLVKFRGVDTRNGAEALRGAALLLDEGELVPLEPGRFYIFQVIGLEVYTEDGRRLGRVTRVLQTGANDVYVVQGDGSLEPKEVLIPALREMVTVDLEAKRITVRPIPGLLE